jgi:hypothetical protein
MFASSVAVNSFGAKKVGHRVPWSRIKERAGTLMSMRVTAPSVLSAREVPASGPRPESTSAPGSGSRSPLVRVGEPPCSFKPVIHLVLSLPGHVTEPEFVGLYELRTWRSCGCHDLRSGDGSRAAATATDSRTTSCSGENTLAFSARLDWKSPWAGLFESRRATRSLGLREVDESQAKICATKLKIGLTPRRGEIVRESPGYEIARVERSR